MSTRKDLLNLATVRTETFKLKCLENTNLKDMDFQLKEMNIAQNKKYNEIMSDINDTNDEDRFDRLVKYACNSVMIEPTFFTEDEFEEMNGFGKAIMDEIFNKIPTIGLTAKEKKEYLKRAEAFAKKQNEEKPKKDEGKEEKK